MKNISAVFILLFIFSRISVNAQSDSLNRIISSAPHDSVRARLCNEYSARLSNSDNKSAMYYAQQAMNYSKKCGDKKAEALSNINLGYSVFYSGNSDSSITLNRIAIKIARAIGDSDLVAMGYNRIGFELRQQGDLAGALVNYNRALQSNKNESDIDEAGFTYLNIGLIYHDKLDYANALLNEEKGLELYKKAKDEMKEANALTRIGNVWLDKRDSVKALEYYKQGLELFQKNNHLRGVAICLNNMAMIYDGKGDHKKGLEYYFRALAIRQKIGDLNGTALVSNNIGAIYESMEMYDSALFYMQKSMDIAKEINYKDMLSTNYMTISSVLAKMGEYDKALDYFKMYHDMQDTLLGEKSREQLNTLNTQFETANKEKQIKELQTETQLKNTALDQQKKRNLFMIAALALLVLLVGAVWRNATRSRKANVILEKQKSEIAAQKKIVEEQHHDMRDSITYAKRIQSAILPSEEERKNIFPKSFVFYSPRDIVSGDFYWMSNCEGKKIIVVGDCTGHGVPGAFMSLIGNTLLNQIVNEKKITDPGKILDHLSDAVVALLKQKEQSQEKTDQFAVDNVRDGMDIALCVIDEKKKEISFSGANNPMLYISQGKLSELKGDRQPIGFYAAEKKPFRTQLVPMNEVEKFYLFSDGITDQFGGADGKKFRISRLKEKLISMNSTPMLQQGTELENSFDEWRGSIEQIDDVLVVGVELE
ncbi:MAG: tetratricopeptide repeat protein [Bacteroidetes bacterium]|nr:tetratricopeptide repeat protein [Bacteroidota bacterium]